MDEQIVIEELCMWERDGSDDLGEFWISECGEEYICVNPGDNNFTYCPYCGRTLDYYYAENENENEEEE